MRGPSVKGSLRNGSCGPRPRRQIRLPRVDVVRIATWNVNSLRSRIDRVEAFLQRHDIDVLALQETKAREDQLPLMGLQALGYDVAVAGLNQWNGVAILSRVGLEDVEVGFAGHAAAAGDPAGRRGARDRRDLRRRTHLVALRPQRPQARRPALRLQARLARPALREAAPRLARRRRPRWSATGTSPHRRRRLRHRRSSRSPPTSPRPSARPSRRFLDDGYADVGTAARHGPGVYTYWDYYRQRFERNRGLRIDFVLGSPSLAERVTGAFIDRDERDPAQGTGSRLRPRAGGRRPATEQPSAPRRATACRWRASMLDPWTPVAPPARPWRSAARRRPRRSVRVIGVLWSRSRPADDPAIAALAAARRPGRGRCRTASTGSATRCATSTTTGSPGRASSTSRWPTCGTPPTRCAARPRTLADRAAQAAGARPVGRAAPAPRRRARRPGRPLRLRRAGAPRGRRALRPDLVVHAGRWAHVVVDAKVPLDAFLDADRHRRRGRARPRTCAATAAAAHARRRPRLASRYWRGARRARPSSSCCSCPAESFLAGRAARPSPTCSSTPPREHVVLATPTTLIALLRTVAHGLAATRRSPTRPARSTGSAASCTSGSARWPATSTRSAARSTPPSGTTTRRWARSRAGCWSPRGASPTSA